MFPFTFVPACYLPVYASQCPLPVHRARLGTWPLARLYQGSHRRLLNFMRFKAQLPIEPCDYSPPRLALGRERPTSLSRKLTCNGYTTTYSPDWQARRLTGSKSETDQLSALDSDEVTQVRGLGFESNLGGPLESE